jgi:hypothetical protein
MWVIGKSIMGKEVIMLGLMKTIREDFLDFVRVMFPDGRIVKPSNDSDHYPESEAIGIAVSPACVDVFARVLVGTTPIYVERSHSLKGDGATLYYGKLYDHSDEFGEVFSDLVEETESYDVREFLRAVRAWVK